MNLISCHKAALYAAGKLGWTVIRCGKDGEPLSLEEISQAVNETVKRKLLNND